MPDPRPCCVLEVCCPPAEAAKALTERLSIPLEVATTLLAEFRLVPRGVPKALHEHLDRQLRDYLGGKSEVAD